MVLRVSAQRAFKNTNSGMDATVELTLVSFAPSEASANVGRRMEEFGYRIYAVEGQVWLDRSAVRERRTAVLAFGAMDFPRERLCAALNQPSGPASLGVFVDSTGPWDRQLLASCREFVGWPCAAEELKYRLERLRARTAILPPTESAAAGREFIDLNLIGRSPAFLHALATIRKLTCCDVPVLVEGETGTGKELVARAIHYLGPRRDHPFIPINCGAIPETLIESELFGHERGAFTDAREAREGVITQAEGGTLFLDEVDSLPLKAQVTLLRFLQDRQYRPLGASRARMADLRLIAATNSDLNEQIRLGRFRLDLLFRLNVLSLKLPPLRERAGDIRLLAETFLARYTSVYRRPQLKLHPTTIAWMEKQPWLGNVRELESFIQRALLLSDPSATTVRVDPLHTDAETSVSPCALESSFHSAKRHMIHEFEKAFLCRALAEGGGNVTSAAKLAGKERRAFGKLLKKYEIDVSQFRSTKPSI